MQMLKFHPLSYADLVGEWVARVRPTFVMRLLGRLRRMLKAIAEERGRRRAIRELRSLDNHVLADIGIARGEIEHVVRCGRTGL